MQQQQVRQIQAAIAVGKLVPGTNPRLKRNPAKFARLRLSIVKAGRVNQPIFVRPRDNDTHEVFAGFGRYEIAKEEFGEDYEMPAVIYHGLSDADALRMAIDENDNREEMSPVDKALAAKDYLAQCGGDRLAAASEAGWAPRYLDQMLALNQCSAAVFAALTAEKIHIGHAELLATKPKAKQDEVLAKLLAMPTRITVAEFKAHLQKSASPLADAIFSKDACVGCEFNATTQNDLFSESIAGEHCTNSDCFSAKTLEAVEAKAASLKDQWATVRIVRPGEDKTIIKLIANGDLGVGEEQATACKGCTNYGAAVSAVPGKEGNVYDGYCFDITCNTNKVAARIKAEKAATNPAAAVKSAASKSGAKGKPTAKTKPSVQDSQRIKDYREKVWREVLAAELTADPGKNLSALTALAITGNARHIDNTAARELFKSLDGSDVSMTNVGEAAASVIAGDKEVRQKMLFSLAPGAAKGLEIRSVQELLRWIDADLGKHWKLNADYLDLLTKTEMEAIAGELGLMAALDNNAQKLLGGKKADLIKGLLTIEGFAYDGLVPGNMKWSSQ
ncbi:MAG: PRTRC system ParB family protein [Sulfuritalea sp.]|nr:PRTRC system ParB family protein [Sulfuritalea sp.]